MSILIQKMVPIFIKKGKKSIIEANLYNYFKLVLKKKKKLLKYMNSLSKKNRSDFNIYIKVKTTKRRRRLFYKFFFNKYKKAEKSFFTIISKNFRESNYNKFSTGFEKQLELFADRKTVVFQKRYQAYKTAFKYRRFFKYRMEKVISRMFRKAKIKIPISDSLKIKKQLPLF